jgi:hypothetical protein
MARMTDAARLARVRRALAKDGEVLRVSRERYPDTQLGRYHIIDASTRLVTACGIKTIDQLEKTVFSG